MERDRDVLGGRAGCSMNFCSMAARIEDAEEDRRWQQEGRGIQTKQTKGENNKEI